MLKQKRLQELQKQNLKVTLPILVILQLNQLLIRLNNLAAMPILNQHDNMSKTKREERLLLPFVESPNNMKQGLYANINAKKARVKAGSGEKMNKVGSKKAPSAQDFKQSAKTAKKK